MDSIYGDVRVERVKFNANQQYEYVENFKILQNTMTKHKVNKPIDPPRLIKCRFQDNFEFLQWLKRFWDEMYQGQDYDAVGRRNGKPGGPVEGNRPMSSASSSSAGAYRTRPAPRVAGRPAPAAAGGMAARGAVRPGSRTTTAGAQQVQELNRQIADARVMVETAEKERDFYFNKLREIEVFIQQSEFDAGSELETLAKHIQAILYSTDDAPADELDNAQDLTDEQYENVAGTMDKLHVDEEETF
ncbi:microtubule integrity protein mal3 [Coemansia sp. RSA 2708]|nr:microtubule integrity protein mal3 [Coemansia sp. RSA 2708]KAJ2320301.1 microtubule integrity protein mal3 [Coemansia sp. RSA 2704]KAJ2738290.1 microtubule integrity protein mal3 [Coemansia sp. Cherry 401B]